MKGGLSKVYLQTKEKKSWNDLKEIKSSHKILFVSIFWCLNISLRTQCHYPSF